MMPKRGFLKRIFSSLLLSGALTASSIAAPDTLPTDSARTIDVTALQNESIKLFGDSVNTSNPHAPHYYPGRYDEEFPLVYTAVTQKEGEVDPKVKALWDNLQKMKNSGTIIGPALMNLSADANIIYSYESMYGAYAMWQRVDGTVRVTTDIPMGEFEMVVLAHETIHGLQTSTGLIQSNFSMSIPNYQAALLSYEAGGMIGGYLFALELREKGITGPWDSLAVQTPRKCAEILFTWEDLRKNNVPYAEALQKTGCIAFAQQFYDRDWLDVYNTGVFARYLNRIVNADLSSPSGQTYTLQDARLSGYITPVFNFTAALDESPADMDLFRGNPRMAQAFDWLQLERLAYFTGRTDASYLEMEKILRAEKNPYIGLNPVTVWNAYIDFRMSRELPDILDGLVRGDLPNLHPNKMQKPRLAS